MNLELRDTIFDLEVLKDKLDDVVATHYWHGDYMYSARELKTKDEKLTYAYGYIENRIHHEQTNDLLTTYLEQLDKLLVKFKLLEQEKALSPDDQIEDNA